MLPFKIDTSPEMSREDTSEVHKYLDQFEAAYPLLFRQRDIFNILLYVKSLRHRDLINKGNLKREFDTGDIVVVRNEAKKTRNDRISQKLVLKIKGTYIVLEKATPI